MKDQAGARNYTWEELRAAHAGGFFRGQQWSRSGGEGKGYIEAKEASWQRFLREMEAQEEADRVKR